MYTWSVHDPNTAVYMGVFTAVYAVVRGVTIIWRFYLCDSMLARCMLYPCVCMYVCVVYLSVCLSQVEVFYRNGWTD